MATFAAATDVLFPGREYDTEELRETLDIHGITSLLTIADAGEGTNAVHVRNPSHARNAQTDCNGYGWTVNCQTTETVSGDETIKITKPWANYELRLFDRQQNRTVWVADIQSRGNGVATWGQMREMLVKSTIKQLTDDGVIESKDNNDVQG